MEIKTVGIKPKEEREYFIPLTGTLRIKNGDLVSAGEQLASGGLDIEEVLRIRGLRGVQDYLIRQIQKVYESQGIPINDKHFEIIVKKMSERVRVVFAGDTSFLPRELVNRVYLKTENEKAKKKNGKQAKAKTVILGITKTALQTDSWLSAASFQNTTSILSMAAIESREDKLLGLKENVIIGRLIPTSKERARLDADD